MSESKPNNMKSLLITILIFGFTLGTQAQKKRDLIKEIKAYKKTLVSNAAYDKEYSEVWDAIYIIATEEYNTISRESESRGYIEAKQEKDTHREYMTIEIRSDKAPFRVSFQVKQEKRIKKDDGTYSNWQTYTSTSLRSYYLRLQSRLYELLNGSIELSDNLQERIDEYNAKQTKERKKILKGKDY